MADTDVAKVSSGLTGTGALNAPVAKKSASATSKTSASSKTSALHAKTAQTKSSTVKPSSPKANTKPSLSSPANPNQKSLSTSKTNLEIKQITSSSDIKKVEPRPSSSLSTSSSKSASSLESRSSNLTSGKLNKSSTSLDTFKNSEASGELRKLSKSSDLNKVSSSSSIDIKSSSKMENTLISKDTKATQKPVGTKKTSTVSKTKATSNLQDSKTVSKSEVNITSTVSDDKLCEQNNQESGQAESISLQAISSESNSRKDDVVHDLSVVAKHPVGFSENLDETTVKSSTESDSSNESFELINISEAKAAKASLPLVEEKVCSVLELPSKTQNEFVELDKVDNESSDPLTSNIKKEKDDTPKLSSNLDMPKDQLTTNVKKEEDDTPKLSSNLDVLKDPLETNVKKGKDDTPKLSSNLDVLKDPLETNVIKGKDDTPKLSSNLDVLKSSSLGLLSLSHGTSDDKVVHDLIDGSDILQGSSGAALPSIGPERKREKVDVNRDVRSLNSDKLSIVTETDPVSKKDELNADSKHQSSVSFTDTTKVSKPISGTLTAVNTIKTDSSPSNNISCVSPKGPENSNADAPIPTSIKSSSTPQPSPEDTKHSIRLKVWENLDKNNFVQFPKPCKGRIPHFVGAALAADKLATLDVFKNAKTIQVNPDKPQSRVRYLTLQEGKQLLVPVSRKSSGFLRKAEAPENATEQELSHLVTQQGIKGMGHIVGLKDDLKVDLVVIGAVAVSKEGHMIGKGQGYADMEFALMMSQNIVTKDTVVACTVHDNQVFDTLPKHLFKSHDIPVDLIVTPTQVIEVKPRLEKPTGIIWNIVSNKRISRTPVLKKIRDEELKGDKDCTLKEVDTDPEEEEKERVRPYFRRHFRNPFRGRRNNMQGRGGGRDREQRDQRAPRENSAPFRAESGAKEQPQPQRNRQGGRTFRRKSVRSNSNHQKPARNSESANSIERKAGGDANNRQFNSRMRFNRKPPMPIEFIMKVSGITRGMRVRDLKAALFERQVKPYDITWAADDGQAYLHFAKDLKNSKPNIISEMTPINVVEGFPAKLELKIEGPPRRYKLDWAVNGKSIDTNRGRMKLATKVDGTVRLLIDEVKPEDSGEYTVTVKNSVGTVTSKAPVMVAAKKKSDSPEAAPKFVNGLQDVNLDERVCLTLSAEISGNPIPEVEWSKDDVSLSSNDRMQFTCDGSKVSLELNSCRVSDGGVYKCKLSNNLGHVESSAKVTISRPNQSKRRSFPVLPQAVMAPESSDAIKNMMEKMRDLKIKSDGEECAKSLSVELANPVTRIESIEVSAV